MPEDGVLNTNLEYVELVVVNLVNGQLQFKSNNGNTQFGWRAVISVILARGDLGIDCPDVRVQLGERDPPKESGKNSSTWEPSRGRIRSRTPRECRPR